VGGFADRLHDQVNRAALGVGTGDSEWYTLAVVM